MEQTGLRLPTTLPDGRFLDAGLMLVVGLLLAVATPALTELGWQYAETGGSALEKIHPATLIAICLFFVSLAYSGNPVRAVSELLAQRPGLAFYLLAVALMILHCLRVVERPFTIFIDTFLLPAVLYMLLCGVSERRAALLARTAHAFIFLNGVLGICEFALGFRTFPLILEGIEIADEWRSSALLGHPLAGALVFGCYILILFMGGARDLPAWLRPVVFVNASLSMVVFGGRAASGFLLFMLALFAIRGGLSLLRGGRIDQRAIMAALLVLPVVALALVGLSEAGFFDDFVSRLSDDEGSASTRIEMFELLRHLTWSELLLLPDAGVIATWSSILGLDFGIESFWLSMILAHGLIVAVFFFAALLIFCREVVTASGRGAISTFIYFFAVASTSLSLSAKTVALAIFVMLVMLMLRPREDVPEMRGERQHQGVRQRLVYAG